MNLKQYNHPILFYTLATVIPWSCWFLAAYLSHMPSMTSFARTMISVLLIIGLCTPAVIALLMIKNNNMLLHDFKTRFFNLHRIQPIYLGLTFFLMLASILLAQAISLFFGYHADQFTFVQKASFSGGMLSGWFWIFLCTFN